MVLTKLFVHRNGIDKHSYLSILGGDLQRLTSEYNLKDNIINFITYDEPNDLKLIMSYDNGVLFSYSSYKRNIPIKLAMTSKPTVFDNGRKIYTPKFKYHI